MAGLIYGNFSPPEPGGLIAPSRQMMGMQSGEGDEFEAHLVPSPLTDYITGPTIGELVYPASFDGDLRDLPQVGPDQIEMRVEMPVPHSVGEGDSAQKGKEDFVDPVAQTVDAPTVMPTPVQNFAGLDFNTWGAGWPPDTNGDVGPNHYIQTVNTSIGIYNKTGTQLAAFTFNNFFDLTGTPCDANNNGDPIVLYDAISDRWIITDFAWTNIQNGPYYECIAVSKTADPVSGGWWMYGFRADDAAHPWLNDYPKLGVWPDGIYMSSNMFDCLTATCSSANFMGVRLWALNRDDLTSGAAIRSGIFDLGNAYDSIFPANLRGALPPAGTPNFFLSRGASPNLRMWKFHVDWVTPANSTLTGPTNIAVAAYTAAGSVPAQGGSNLDALSDRLMVQVQYRNVGGTESLWATHSVTSGGVAGIRWYEIRTPNATPTLYQQGTYQPDAVHRWMGSLAVDQLGNMAVGYSASSSSMFPAIRYAGRLSSDPLGTLGQGEATLIAGAGSQTTYSRWGDYSAMTIDPVDGCTFWYTTEYYNTTGTNWQTRIGSFKFPSCSPDFTISAAPTALDICKPGSGASTLTLGALGGFNSPVTLTDSGAPAGVTTSFGANPVTPPGTSAYNVNVGAGAANGNYSLVVTGTSGAVSHQSTIALVVSDAAPGAAPTLVSPANAALGQALTNLAFQWNAATGAASYRLQVDDNADFSSPVADVNGILTTNYTLPGPLSASTLYYWRVFAVNACGQTPSSAFTFATQGSGGSCGLGTTLTNIYSTDFEGGLGSWTHSGTGDTWAWSTARSHSATHSVYAIDPATVSDQRLVSPAVSLVGVSSPNLQFWNYQHMETATVGCFDGGILEVSTDGGSNWTQVTGGLQTDPYDGPISTGFSNPLAGLNAWCGNNPQNWLNSVVDLGPYAGQNVSFRFRLGSDNSVNREGWYIDDVVVQGCTPQAYTLSINTVGSGTVTASPNQATYTYGQIVSLTPVPAPGWAFSGWSGDLSGSANPATLLIDGNKSVTATFVQTVYTLVVILV